MSFPVVFPNDAFFKLLNKDHTLRCRVEACWELLGFGLHMALPNDDCPVPMLSNQSCPNTEDDCLKELESLVGSQSSEDPEVIKGINWLQVLRIVKELLDILTG